MKKEDLKIVALIPARSGSKRLPGKNIKDFCGKPLIAWTIEAALKSKYIDSVVVSTDCSKIAEISKQYGAEVPFLRPESLSDDKTTTVDVVKNFLDFSESKTYTHLILLQPTSPLRETADIDNSVELMIKNDANAIYSVCEVDHPPEWSNSLPDDQSFDNFLRPEVLNKRSQDLPKSYRLNGAIYLVSIHVFKNVGTLHSIRPSFAYIMDKKNSIDIDDEQDFVIAEIMMKSFL